MLTQFNFDSDNCSNGSDALQKVSYRLAKNLPGYKLILIDYSMPGIDGPTTTSLIRELYSAKQKEERQKGAVTNCPTTSTMIKELFSEKELEESQNSKVSKQPFICFVTAY